jgi:hypothetical protein
MRPGERDANDSYNRGNEVGKRQPPTGEDEPEDIAKNAEGSRTQVMLTIVGAAKPLAGQRAAACKRLC